MNKKNAALVGAAFFIDMLCCYTVVVDDGPLNKPSTNEIIAITIKI